MLTFITKEAEVEGPKSILWGAELSLKEAVLGGMGKSARAEVPKPCHLLLARLRLPESLYFVIHVNKALIMI